MWAGPDDIPSPFFVFDLEWVGNSAVPSQTHLTQIAVTCVQTGESYSDTVRPFASSAAVHEANSKMGRPSSCPAGNSSPKDALIGFFDWLKQQCHGETSTIVLIAHNGIRYDAPVLAANAQRYGVALPPGLTILDSLYHFRHHLRYRDPFARLDLDSISDSLGISVNGESRHDAIYDVKLLHAALAGMSTKWDIPYISGYPQPMCFSPMLVHGIGPTICMRLGTSSLLELCTRILDSKGALDADSCRAYLDSLDLRAALPAINIPLISKHVAPTARRYLHYLE